MEVELKSDWQDIQVELLKSLHGYEVEKFNEKIGSIDYVAEKEDGEKKLLRVIVDPEFNASKAYMDTTRKTLAAVEDGPYDEATLLARGLTKASKRLVRKEEDLKYISPKNKYYSLVELIAAIQKRTRKLCEIKCGKFPTSEGDCNGYQNGEYTCPVRRISDDADFHAERNWLQLLMKDFSRLVMLQKELDN